MSQSKLTPEQLKRVLCPVKDPETQKPCNNPAPFIYVDKGGGECICCLTHLEKYQAVEYMHEVRKNRLEGLGD